jgi:serine protease Do
MRLNKLPHKKRNLIHQLLLLCIIALIFSTSEVTAQFSRETPAVLAVRKVGPAVVNINTEEIIVQQSPFAGLPGFFPPEFNQFFRGFNTPQRRKRKSLGSGVIINTKGFILTNEHVIRRATSIRVSLIDRREFEAEVVGADFRSDLAVIRIRAKKPLPHVSMSNTDNLMPGERVIAIGNPFGLGQTVTTGIISGIHRAVRLKGGIQTDFIQTDAAINPGNSGGPLLNINGELIGINTAIRAQAEGIGFAVPIDRVKRIVNDLLRFGEIKRGWAGLIVRNLTRPIRNQFGYPHRFGVFISRVLRKGAAARAGIEPGMILMHIGRNTVESRAEFLSDMAGYTKGSKMFLELFWKGETIRRTVIAESFTAEEADMVSEDLLGIIVREITKKRRSQYQIKATDGVVITQTIRRGPADRVNLQVGDVIRKINNRRIKTFTDFQNILASGQYIRGVLFLIQRGTNQGFVTIQPRG